jgi:UDP-N-acetylglucosamine--N-acetylmuramyl-(pentapeptide) pyrophosphoryl-undecaprenol N-acetylglucosamine transferase
MSGRCPVVVAAGGTGGHLFPAAALSHALAARGMEVHLVTDQRVAKFGGDFPAHAIHKVAAATPSGGTLFSRATAIFTLIRGTVAARRLVKRIRPRAVIGFGGYPTVPPLLAATQLRVPTLLHEGNAVIGRANRFLASRVDAIAKSFDLDLIKLRPVRPQFHYRLKPAAAGRTSRAARPRYRRVPSTCR